MTRFCRLRCGKALPGTALPGTTLTHRENVDCRPQSRYASPPLKTRIPPPNKRSSDGGYFDGVDTSDYLDNPASWRRASVATQQKLGLWTKRRTGSGFGDCADSSAVGKNLDKTPISRDLGACDSN